MPEDTFLDFIPDDTSRPWLVRTFTSREEKRPREGGRVDWDRKEISFRSGSTPERTGQILRHEIGHVQHPHNKMGVPGSSGDILSEEPLDFAGEFSFMARDVGNSVYGELLASYFSLDIDPKDDLNRGHIIKQKKNLLDVGFPKAVVSRLDKQARERVGYTGREVK